MRLSRIRLSDRAFMLLATEGSAEVVAVLPRGLVQALGPVLEQIAEMTKKIKHYDRLIKGLTETEYPEAQALIQVYGVGQLTALTYVLTLGNKERFQRSRDVGCYLGLRPDQCPQNAAAPANPPVA